MRSALVRSELGYICRYAFYLLPKFLHHRTSIRLPANPAKLASPRGDVRLRNPR